MAFTSCHRRLLTHFFQATAIVYLNTYNIQISNIRSNLAFPFSRTRLNKLINYELTINYNKKTKKQKRNLPSCSRPSFLDPRPGIMSWTSSSQRAGLEYRPWTSSSRHTDLDGRPDNPLLGTSEFWKVLNRTTCVSLHHNVNIVSGKLAISSQTFQNLRDELS